MWFVYIVKCKDGTLYTGITNDLERRIGEHNSSELGAKYTRARRPVELVYQFSCPNRSTALKEERRIKKMGRGEKLELIAGL
jgi:putative endonuclease